MRLLALAMAAGLIAASHQGASPRRPAGDEPPSAAVKETPHLRVSVSAAPARIAAGRRVTLTVRVEPKPKMHVYAPGQPDYIPVSLAIDANPAITAAAPTFPSAERLVFPPLNEQQLVYAKPFAITDVLTVGPARALQKSAPAGTLTVSGTLHYQACDDTVCYRPASVPLQWTLTLATAR